MPNTTYNIAEFPSMTTTQRLLTMFAPGVVVWDATINLAFIGDGVTLGGNLMAIETLATGLVAAGTTQATGLVLVAVNNIVATTAASTGVVLPTIVGQEIMVINRGASTLNVFPPLGAQIDSVAVNTAVTLATTVKGGYLCASATQYYTIR